MTYTAQLTPSGTYQVFSNGQLVSTTSVSGLAQFGLSPTQLTQSTAGSVPVVNGPSTIGTGGASIAVGATNSPNSTQSGGYQFTPVSGGVQVNNNGQNLGVMSVSQAQNLGYSNPIPTSLYTQIQGAVQQGTMSPAQAVSYLQGMIGTTYTGSLNTSQLFPAGFTYTSGGQQYQIGQAGAYQSPVKTTATVNVSTPQGTGTAAATGGAAVGSGLSSTGNSNLDQVQAAIAGVANNLIGQGYTIPADLQITPALVSEFLSLAHQAVDPYTQQLLSGEIDNVNANLADMSTDYLNSVGQQEQNFGVALASQDNSAAQAGTAFSGQRNVNDLNLASTTNRGLATTAADASYNMGNAARAGAAAVGAPNAGGIQLPSLSTGTVSLSGGQYGSNSPGANLSLNYNPSLYTVGTIPSDQTQAVNEQQQSYLSQYGTLAGAQSNSGKSVSDLIPMISGLPSNYSLPTNLS